MAIAKRHLYHGQTGVEGKPEVLQFADLNLAVAYGAKVKHYLFLSSAVILSWSAIRVPTNPSSYTSEVTLIDPANGGQSRAAFGI